MHDVHHSGDESALRMRERGIFESLLIGGERRGRGSEIRRTLSECGLRRDDPRLTGLMGSLDGLASDATLDEAALFDAVRPGLLLLESAVGGSLVIPDFAGFRDVVRGLF